MSLKTLIGETKEKYKSRNPAKSILSPFNLRTKITIPYLFLAILLIIGAGFLVTRIVFDTIESRFVNQLVESGKLASEGMVNEEDELLATYRLLANTTEITSAIGQGNSEKIRELSLGTIVNNQEEAVVFMDPSGNVLLKAKHKLGGTVEEYDFSKGGKTDQNLDFIMNVFNQSSDHLGDKYSGYTLDDGRYFFYVAGPVLDKAGNFAGVIMVGNSLQSISQKLREITLGQITMYDKSGMVLSSTLANPLNLPIERVNEVLAMQDSNSYRRELNRQLEVNQINYEEILGPWEGRGDLDMGILGVSLTKSFLINSTRVTRLQTVLLTILTLTIVLVVGILLSGMITSPIKKLVKASQEVAAGNLDVQLESTTNDEISVLMQTFNQMVTNLNISNNNLLNTYDSTLEGWSKALEMRDKETLGHTSRVTELTMKIAKEMGIPEARMLQVKRGSLLHDIGKMGIPDSILLKPGKLDQDELAVMRRHPHYAYEMLKHIDFLQPALTIPYFHHEYWDGTGYPRGLKGVEIPLEARIFAIVDVWDALSSDRPYRKALPPDQVIDIIKSEIGTHFDPEVGRVFLEMYEKGKF